MVERIDRNVESNLYCTGIQIVNPARINEITTPCDGFYDVWNQLIAQREVVCSRVHPRTWYAVDTVEQLQQVNEQVSK